MVSTYIAWGCYPFLLTRFFLPPSRRDVAYCTTLLLYINAFAVRRARKHNTMEENDYQVIPTEDSGQNGTHTQQNVYVQQVVHKSNGMGVTGFILAIINAVLFWIPFIDLICIILWPLALIFSLIGVFRTPKGLAVAGLILAILPIFFLIAGAGALAGIMSMS